MTVSRAKTPDTASQSDKIQDTSQREIATVNAGQCDKKLGIAISVA